MAYYEDGKVYVVSDNLISLNSNSSFMFYVFKSVISIVFTNGKYNMVDTSQVTNMLRMFDGCSSLTSLDLSNFDTSKVTNMTQMFYGCSSLTSLDVSKWNTSQVTSMSGMFLWCSNLTSLDVSKWNTKQVTNMSYMFKGANNLNEIIIGCNWVTAPTADQIIHGTKYTQEQFDEMILNKQQECLVNAN